jgi:hypothetical protein
MKNLKTLILIIIISLLYTAKSQNNERNSREGHPGAIELFANVKSLDNFLSQLLPLFSYYYLENKKFNLSYDYYSFFYHMNADHVKVNEI